MKRLPEAIHYAELGYAVLLLAPGSKKPLPGTHGLLDATTDENAIIEEFERHPDANIGLRTGGLLVVDVDGVDNPWLTDERVNAFCFAPCQRTPGGGCQFLFRQPTGKAWSNTASRIASKVDTHANGGYIAVPPSERLDGKYQWVPGQELDYSPFELPLPPDWLIAELDRVASPDGGHFSGVDQRIPQRRRNDTLCRLGGYVRRAGLAYKEILALLRTTNALRCDPPLPAYEVESVARSVMRYLPDQISSALVFDDLDDDPFPGDEAAS